MIETTPAVINPFPLLTFCVRQFLWYGSFSILKKLHLYYCLYFPFFGQYLSLKAFLLSESGTDQLLKASLVLCCQVLILSVPCHGQSLITRKAHSQYIMSHREEKISSFPRILRQGEAEHRKALLSCFFKSRAWVIFNSNFILLEVFYPSTTRGINNRANPTLLS